MDCLLECTSFDCMEELYVQLDHNCMEIVKLIHLEEFEEDMRNIKSNTIQFNKRHAIPHPLNLPAPSDNELLNNIAITRSQLSKIVKGLPNDYRDVLFDYLYSCIVPYTQAFSADDLSKNYYKQHIKLPDTKHGNTMLVSKELAPYNLFVYNFMINNCSFLPCIGYLTTAYTVNYMVVDNIIISSGILPLEMYTMQNSIDAAHGDVLVLGLQLGYFPVMCSAKDNVNSITVVEENKEIVDIFMDVIYPQVPNKEKITVINNKPEEFVKSPCLKNFNFGFACDWRNHYQVKEFIKLENAVKSFCYSEVEFHFWLDNMFNLQLMRIGCPAYKRAFKMEN